MKKTIQKTVSFVLVFLMVFSCLTVLPTEVFHSLAARAAELVTSVTGADETYTSGDYTYTLINEYTEVNITGYSGSETELKLPSELDGKRVSAVGNGAFRSNGAITSVVIPDTVTYIADCAFEGCTNLEEVTFGSSVKTIGSYAFKNCQKLVGAQFPDSLETIGYQAFYNDRALADVSFNEGLKTIGEEAFRSSGVRSVKLPSTMTDMGRWTFSSCGSLKDAEISGSDLTVGYCSFEYCYALESVVIGSGVKTVDSYAFNNNTAIKTVSLSDDVKTIGDYVFSSCRSLNTLVFGKEIGYIGNNAVTGYSDLTVYCHEDTYAHDYAKGMANVTIKLILDNYYVTDLAVKRLSSHSVTFGWNKPKGFNNIDHYIIYKDGVSYDTVTKTEYSDGSLDSGVEYVYSVYAVDSEGVISEERQLSVIPACSQVESVTPPNGGRLGGLREIKLSAKMTDSLGAEGAAGKFVYSSDKTNWLDACAAAVQNDGMTYTGGWSLGEVPTGEYTLRFVFTDRDGGTSFSDAEISVDRTAPEKIFGFAARGQEDRISLTWGIAAEIDTGIYRIYRKSEGSAEGWRLITEIRNRDTLSYDDKKVAEGTIYSYYIVGVDEFGQESEKSELVMAGMIDDTTPPRVTKLTPSNNSVIYGMMNMTAAATDNLAVSRIELYWSADGSEWSLLDSAYGTFFSKKVDTTVMPNGRVSIKAVAYDLAENKSDSTPVYSYIVDNQGPEKVTGLSAKSISSTVVTLEWQDVSDDDRYFFSVEQKQPDGSFREIQREYYSLGANITDLLPSTEYVFRVAAYDRYGNRGEASDELSFTTEKDASAPVVTLIKPDAGYYSETLPLRMTVRDDYLVSELTIRTSRDGESWTDLITLTADEPAKTVVFSYNLDLTSFSEGSVFVSGICKDTEGNVTPEDKAAHNEYIIDRTAPKTAQNVGTSSGERTIRIFWEPSESTDTDHYIISRSAKQDGGYIVLSNCVAALDYYDSNVDQFKTYYYRLQAVDRAGNVGEYSQPVEAQVLADTVKPAVAGFDPGDGSSVSPAFAEITALFTDNVKLRSASVCYSREETPGEFVTLAGEDGINDPRCSLSAKLPVEELDDGERITVRFACEDTSGNSAETVDAVYTVDKTAPVISDLSAVQNSEGAFEVTWKTDSDDAVSCLSRKAEGEADFKPVEMLTGKDCSFTDADYPTAGKHLEYRVTATDQLGNSSCAQTGELTISGSRAPIAVMNCPTSLMVNVDYSFDASASYDDRQITGYEVSFGDGATASGAKTVHRYTSVGTYTLTLTVTDDDGNSATCQKTVSVNERAVSGELNVKLTDGSGKTLSGIPVYLDLGESDEQQLVSDGSGRVTFPTSIGTHTVGAYADGYLPVLETVTVLGGENSKHITLTEQPIVTGEFEIHKMSFTEIIAAGIDINAPENQSVVRINVRLNYQGTPVEDEIIWNGVEVTNRLSFITDHLHVRRSLTPHVFVTGPSSLSPGGTHFDPSKLDLNRVQVAYIDIPISARSIPRSRWSTASSS